MDINVHQLESEMERWREHLNLTVGILTYTVGLACLGLRMPSLYAGISFIFISLIGISGAKYFPPMVRALRDKQRTTEEDIVYRGIMSKYFGLFPALKTVPVFFFSWIFLGLIMAGVIKN